jgi:hypothetical protein
MLLNLRLVNVRASLIDRRLTLMLGRYKKRRHRLRREQVRRRHLRRRNGERTLHLLVSEGSLGGRGRPVNLLLNLVSLEVEGNRSTIQTVVVVASTSGRSGPVIEGRVSVAAVRSRGPVAPVLIPAEGGRSGSNVEVIFSKLLL